MLLFLSPPYFFILSIRLENADKSPSTLEMGNNGTKNERTDDQDTTQLSNTQTNTETTTGKPVRPQRTQRSTMTTTAGGPTIVDLNKSTMRKNTLSTESGRSSVNRSRRVVSRPHTIRPKKQLNSTSPATPRKKVESVKAKKPQTTRKSTNTTATSQKKKNVQTIEKVEKKEKKETPISKEEATITATAKVIKKKDSNREKRGNVSSAETVQTVQRDVQPTEEEPLQRSEKMIRKSIPSKSHEAAIKLIDAILAKGVQSIQAEFSQLRQETMPKPEEYNSFLAPQNSERNRYKDVPCADISRVRLLGAVNDYIHANYCPTAVHPKRFICSQGPLSQTARNFWWMILAEKCEYIVMLCNFEELGKPKCAVYLPMEENNTMYFDDISVKCLSVTRVEAPQMLGVRKLKIERGTDEESRVIEHVHWEAWPDRSVPQVDATPIKLLEKVCVSQNPVLVHCSAGIGRTGTIVAIQMALDHIASGKTLDTGLAPLLKELRKYRMFSVQTDQQYLFIHRVLLGYYMDPRMLSNPKVQQFLADYAQAISL